MNVSVGSGRFTSGVADLYFAPATRVATNPIVYAHGLNDTGPGVANNAHTLEFMRWLTSLGYSIVCPSTSNGWGNATVQARLADALTWHRANLGGVGKPIMLGISMGASGVLNYAAANPNTTACVAAFIPCVDLEAVRALVWANAGTDAFQFDPAWGVTWPQLLPQAAQPILHTTELDRFPQQFWQNTGDFVSTNLATYAALMHAEAYTTTKVGHDFTVFDDVDRSMLFDFIQTNT